MKNLNNKKNGVDLIMTSPEFKEISREMEVLVELAIAVNERRRLKDWSQQKLAEEVGTTQAIISKIENADINIGLDLLQRLARSLGVVLQFGSAKLVKGELDTSDKATNLYTESPWVTVINSFSKIPIYDATMGSPEKEKFMPINQ